MSKDTLQGKWQEVQGKVKEQWGKLTNDDITRINGDWDQLEGKLRQVYGYNQEKAKQEIEAFVKKTKIGSGR